MLSGWFPRLIVVTVATQVVVYMLRPLLSYQAIDLGIGPSGLGVMVAAFSVLSLPLAVPAGQAVDRWGERGILVIGAAILAATIMVLALVTGFTVLVVGSALVGLGQMLTMVACQTLIANDREEIRRDQRFAHFTVATSIAQFGAPAVGGMLIVETHTGERDWAPSYVTLVLSALLGLAFSLSLFVRPGALAARPQHFGKAGPGVLREVLGSRTVLVGLTVGFASLSAIDLLTAFLPAYGESRGIPPQVVGFLIATYGISSIAARLVLQRLIAALGRRKLLIACLVGAAACLAATPFQGSVPVLVLLMVLGGATLGLCQPIALAWVASGVRPQVRGTAMSVRLAGNRLGQTVVPLGVAALAGPAGLASAFLGPAVLLGVAAALVFRSGAPEPGSSTTTA